MSTADDGPEILVDGIGNMTFFNGTWRFELIVMRGTKPLIVARIAFSQESCKRISEGFQKALAGKEAEALIKRSKAR